LKQVEEAETKVDTLRAPATATAKPVRVAGAFLTRRCNLQCDYCGVTKRRFERELNASEWIDALSILESVGIQRVALLGGEPTIVEGIEQIIHFLAGSSMTFSLISNCIIPEQRLKTIVDAGLERFSASIDTFGDTPIQLNHGSVSKSQAGLRTLLKLKSWQVPHLTAYLVMTRRNIDRVVALAEYLSSEGIWLYLLPYHWGSPEQWENRAVDRTLGFTTADCEPLQAVVDQICRLKQSGTLVSNSMEFLREFPVYAPTLSWHCAPSTSELRVDADGSLTCCNDIRGEVATQFSVFQLRDPARLAEFQFERGKDAQKCPGCFWPSHYHALVERFRT
jgi:MoaA/NifB/PqqE/SkfB family radical SAM enzyme